MSAVKAYNHNSTIVVQYFDSGQAQKINCPKCKWSGAIPQMPFIGECGTVEICCNKCPTTLALVYASSLAQQAIS